MFLDRFLPSLYDRRVVKKTIPLIHERIKKMGEYLHLCDFFFSPPSKYEQDLISHKDLLHSIAGSLEDVVDWKAGVIGETMQGAAQREGIKNRDFFMILRIAITGKKITPPLNESMELLGREECVERLKKAVKK